MKIRAAAQEVASLLNQDFAGEWEVYASGLWQYTNVIAACVWRYRGIVKPPSTP